ncbi:hypothetical protein BH23BAC1_BH23BAC1_50880 [soil metagenome]
MLATTAEKPFSDPNWIFEVKWDGYRIIANKSANEVRLFSRNGNDFSNRYPAVTTALSKIAGNFILDGEVVVLDKNGIPDFQQLQNSKSIPAERISYMAFDLLYLQDKSLLNEPVEIRKQMLKDFLPQQPQILFSDHFEREGEVLFDEMKKRGMEGIVAKRKGSKYKPGEKSKEWLKIPVERTEDFIVGGFQLRENQEYIKTNPDNWGFVIPFKI